jgi:hypothetical protein
MSDYVAPSALQDFESAIHALTRAWLLNAGLFGPASGALQPHSETPLICHLLVSHSISATAKAIERKMNGHSVFLEYSKSKATYGKLVEVFVAHFQQNLE